MRKNLVIVMLISFPFLSSCNYANNDEITINTILNEIVSQDSTILDKKCKLVSGFNSALQIPASDYLDKEFFPLLSPYFSISDSVFYSNQIKENKLCKLYVNQMPGSFKSIPRRKIINFIAKVESDNIKEKEFDFWERFEKKIGDVQEFSLPLISKDGKYVLVRFMTFQLDKSRGFVKIYEKQNGRWTVVKSIREWDKRRD